MLLVRPRGLHLPERHVSLNGSTVPGAFVDFGLFMHRNAEEQLARGRGPYSTSRSSSRRPRRRCGATRPRMSEDELGLDRGTIKATVLIEILPAAFCMDAILYELRDHVAGLNAAPGTTSSRRSSAFARDATS